MSLAQRTQRTQRLVDPACSRLPSPANNLYEIQTLPQM